MNLRAKNLTLLNALRKIIYTQTLNLIHGQTTQERMNPEDAYAQLSPREADPTFKYSSLEVQGLIHEPHKNTTFQNCASMCCAGSAMNQQAIFDYVRDAHSSPDRFRYERVDTVI